MVKMKSERPVIDVEFTSEDIFWDIEGLQLPSLSRSLLSIKLILQQLLRRDFEITSFFQAILDKIIIKRIPEKYIELYIRTTPYILESFCLLPVFFIYRIIDDPTFYDLHCFLGPLRIFALWNYPTRLTFALLKTSYDLIIPSSHHIRILLGRHSPKWFFLWFTRTSFSSISRKLILCLGLCAEIFGERMPNDRILAHKAPVAKSSFCNKKFLNNLQGQKYDPKNLPLLDLMLHQDAEVMELEIIPDLPHCIGEKSLEQKVLQLKHRKKLRIRSKFHARKLRNGITRSLLR